VADAGEASDRLGIGLRRGLVRRSRDQVEHRSGLTGARLTNL
jgi:hypothetical protein